MNASRSLTSTQTTAGTGSQAVVPLTEVAVTGVGLACKTGDQPFALFGAVATHLTSSTPHNDFSGNGDSAADIRLLIAAVPEVEDLDTPQERITSLAGSALKQTLNFLPQPIEGKDILVLTLLPEAATERGASLNREQLQTALTSQHSTLTTACFRFAGPYQGAVLQLQKACAELVEGKWQVVIFGGADSLVDIVTCASLIQTNSAMLQKGAGGVVLGEGAAFLLLEKCNPSNPSSEFPSIGAMAACEEPHPGKAEDDHMTGLATALRNTLATAKLSPAAIKSIVLPLDGNIADEMEWHQTVETLWPRRDNIPRRFEELRPHLSLGDTGAATLPLALALASARLDFRFPSVDNIFVCEVSRHSPRGVVYLKVPPTRKENNSL
jgi:3-oxoacyl-[acyl-carrier-protein] synthase-1